MSLLMRSHFRVALLELLNLLLLFLAQLLIARRFAEIDDVARIEQALDIGGRLGTLELLRRLFLRTPRRADRIPETVM